MGGLWVSFLPLHITHKVIFQLDESSVDSSIQISSFQKNGNKIWRIHLSSSQELLDARAKELQESTPMSSHGQTSGQQLSPDEK